MTYKCISRGEAKAKGLKRYFTGKPCKRGHIAERLVSVRKCAVCDRAASSCWARANSEQVRDYKQRWYKANSERERESACRRYRANPGRMKETVRRWQKANPERVRKYKRRWEKVNCDKVYAKTAKRRSVKMKRTPPWADLKAIERFYHDAKVMAEMTGEPWHVDHVIPLQGKMVSGLHVHTNLQILPGRENSRKSNKFVPQETTQFT